MAIALAVSWNLESAPSIPGQLSPTRRRVATGVTSRPLTAVRARSGCPPRGATPARTRARGQHRDDAAHDHDDDAPIAVHRASGHDNFALGCHGLARRPALRRRRGSKSSPARGYQGARQVSSSSRRKRSLTRLTTSAAERPAAAEGSTCSRREVERPRRREWRSRRSVRRSRSAHGGSAFCRAVMTSLISRSTRSASARRSARCRCRRSTPAGGHSSAHARYGVRWPAGRGPREAVAAPARTVVIRVRRAGVPVLPPPLARRRGAAGPPPRWSCSSTLAY